MVEMNKDGEFEYTLTEASICYILNEVLAGYMVIWPLNMRYQAQKRFMKELHHLKKVCPDCKKPLSINGECYPCQLG